MCINTLRFEHVAISDPNSGEIDNDGTFKKGVAYACLVLSSRMCSVVYM